MGFGLVHAGNISEKVFIIVFPAFFINNEELRECRQAIIPERNVLVQNETAPLADPLKRNFRAKF
jgi:hypothetical protein